MMRVPGESGNNVLSRHAQRFDCLGKPVRTARHFQAARAENTLAEIGLIEARFEHDRVYNRHGGRGQGDSREPARPNIPSQDKVRHGCAANERRHEPNQADDRHLFPFFTKHGGFKLRPSQKREEHRARARQKTKPGQVAAKAACAEIPIGHESRRDPDADFNQRDRYPQMIRKRSGGDRQPHP